MLLNGHIHSLAKKSVDFLESLKNYFLIIKNYTQWS
jgi:hypothetical protein